MIANCKIMTWKSEHIIFCTMLYFTIMWIWSWYKSLLVYYSLLLFLKYLFRVVRLFLMFLIVKLPFNAIWGHLPPRDVWFLSFIVRLRASLFAESWYSPSCQHTIRLLNFPLDAPLDFCYSLSNFAC